MIPMAVRIKALIKLLPRVCPTNKPISLESVENLLLSEKKSATLAGCQILLHKKGIFISKELRTPEKKKTFQAGESGFWDRFWIATPKKMVCDYMAPSPRLKDIPYLVQKTFPPMNTQKIHFSIETSAFCGIYFPKVPVCTQKELEKKEYILIDQLLPPIHTELYLHYFENIKVVIVDRDPRDYYVCNNLFWGARYIPSSNLDTYISWYKKTRECVFESENVKKMYLEDFVYRYDTISKELIEFVGLKENNHFVYLLNSYLFC